VGIICADLSLNFPDFRAAERTFQLLAQVAGRAGRGSVPGNVILQTYNPDHFSILSATAQDFQAFYNDEIGFREHAQALGDLCFDLKRNDRSFLRSLEILGPIEAPIPKIAKHYRWQILLKGRSVKPLHEFLHKVWFENRAAIQNRDVKVVLDVDPFFMT